MTMETAYEAAKKRTEPHAKIVETLPEIQRNTVGLVKKVVGENQRV